MPDDTQYHILLLGINRIWPRVRMALRRENKVLGNRISQLNHSPCGATRASTARVHQGGQPRNDAYSTACSVLSAHHKWGNRQDLCRGKEAPQIDPPVSNAMTMAKTVRA